MTDTKFILVVEDDPILKNLLGHTLAGKYQTLYASDGNEALALFEQNKPALVLLDLMLPTMDGYAVLETIRKRTDDLAKTPIIIVSNLGQQKDIDRAKQLGANDFLIKAEVPIEDIVKKIETMLGAEAVSAPAAVPPPAAPPAQA
jgi:CheY-like chemotaxis protein